MTEYNHSYEERILTILEKHDRISYNKLRRYTGMRENKFASTVKRLKNAKQIENKIRITANGKVASEYFLTKYTRTRRIWQIKDRVKTKREARNISHKPLHDRKAREKALLLITHHAAFGYEDINNKKPSEVELGDVSIISPNNGTIEQHSLHMRKKPGVSIDDLTNKIPGINRAAIFTYMDYSEQELKRYFNSLIKQKSPVLTALQKHDDWATTRYVIANKDLEVFIKKCWVMFYTVRSRMVDTWTYIRGPTPDSEETKWYVTFFGTKITEDLIKTIEKGHRALANKNEKDKQDFINSVYNEIKHNDVNIIASYNQLLSGNYKHILKKYRLIVNPLLEACYPSFLRILHEKNEI
jgi:hypothetical protein